MNSISSYFAQQNAGKRCVSIDMDHAKGRALVLQLAEHCDVLIENFRPGVMDRLGLGYDHVVARNPRIVYVSISGFGQTGPLSGVPAHDVATEAMGGIVSLNLGNDGQPAMPPVPIADLTASLLALSGILMALLRRRLLLWHAEALAPPTV